MIRRMFFFVFMVLALVARAASYDNVTIDPADGSTVDKLHYFTLTFTDKSNVAPTWSATASLYNSKTNKFVANLDCTFAVGHKGVSLYLLSDLNVNGEYTLKIPAGLADLGDGTKNKAMQFSYTIKGGVDAEGGDDNPVVPNKIKYTCDPADGSTVASISDIVITFDDAASASYDVGIKPYVLDARGQKVEDGEMTYGIAYNQLAVEFEPITKSGKYEVVLPAGLVDLDGKATTQDIVLNYTIIGSAYERMTLVEHFTSLACVNCPSGDENMEKLYEQYGSNMAWVTHRVGYKNDEFTLSQSSAVLGFGIDGNPEVMYDRTALNNGTPVLTIGGDAYDEVEKHFQTVNAVPAQMGVEVTAVYDNNMLKVDVKGDRLPEAASADYTLHIYVVEDQVTSVKPQTGSSPLRYVHDNILRLIGTPDAGAALQWSDNAFSYCDTLKIDASWKREDMRVIAFVTKATPYIAKAPTGEVMNVAMTKVRKATIDGSEDEILADMVRPANCVLTGTADAKGELKAQLSITAPTTYRYGNALEGKVDVVLLRDGTVLKNYSMQAGESTVCNETFDLKGLHLYQAVAKQVDQVSDTVTLSLYVGHDIPEAPHPIQLTKDKGTVHLSWQMPGGGHGGYVDTESMRYSVVRVRQLPGDLKLVTKEIAKGLTEPRCDDTPEQLSQGVFYYYRVYAYNEAGQCEGYGRSDGVVLAETATLPFEESFAGGKLSTFWVEEHDVSSRFWPMQVANKFTQDNDEGVLAFTPYQANEWSRYLSGPISLKGTGNPMLNAHLFYVTPQEDVFAVGISVNGGEWKELLGGALDDAQVAKQWIPIEIPLAEYKDADYIQLCFECRSSTTVTVVYVDNVSVVDKVENNLAVTSLNGPRQLKDKREAKATLTLKNKGQKDVTSQYDVEVSLNDQVVATIAGPSLMSGEEKTVDFVFTPGNEDTDSVRLTAEVLYQADQVAYDDTLSILVPYSVSTLPAPRNVQWHDGILSWEAPEAPRSKDEYVTDDFEQAPDFCLKNFGNWTLQDKDNMGTYFAASFPGAGQPHAYVVLNTAKVEKLNETGFDWSTHSGDKMLVAFAAPLAAADNWLISPELSGHEQTLEFYARSIDAAYPEDYKVMVAKQIDGEYTSILEGVVKSEWEKVSVKLPKDYKYFAIVNHTPAGRAFALDDITFVPDTLAAQHVQLQGYHVYTFDEDVTTEKTSTTSARIHGTPLRLAVAAVYDAENEQRESRRVYAYDHTGVAGISAASNGHSKFVRDGRIVIVKNGKVYNTIGARMR